MAVDVETAAPGPSWQRGRVVSWFVTVDHKRIGILYLATAGLFFVAGGIMALLIRTLLLALPLRRDHPAALVLRNGRRGERWLDELPAELDLRAGQRSGPLDPLAARAHDRVARGSDQLRRHDPQPAHAGHELDATAAVRLVDRGLRDPVDRRPTDALRRPDAAFARPPGGHALLRSRARSRQSRAPILRARR